MSDGAGASKEVSNGAFIGSKTGAYTGLKVVSLMSRQRKDSTGPNLELASSLFQKIYFRKRGLNNLVNHTNITIVETLSSLFVFQCGDGGVIYKKDDQWSIACKPAKGSYANETKFMRPTKGKLLICSFLVEKSKVQGLIFFSDGLEPHFLTESHQTGIEINSSFSNFTFDYISNAKPLSAFRSMNLLLRNSDIDSLSADDKTLGAWIR